MEGDRKQWEAEEEEGAHCALFLDLPLSIFLELHLLQCNLHSLPPSSLS